MNWPLTEHVTVAVDLGKLGRLGRLFVCYRGATSVIIKTAEYRSENFDLTPPLTFLIIRSFPMQRLALTLFFCSLVLAVSSLQAQEADSPISLIPVDQTAQEKVVDSLTEAAKDPSVLTMPEEDVAEKVSTAQQSNDVGQIDDVDLDGIEADDESESTDEGVLEAAAIVSVNAQGELVGQTKASINGDLVPIESNVTLVSGGVLLGKTVTDVDGSFSFSNVVPGNYDIYGCASSYCGQRSCTVVSTGEFDVVNVELDQLSTCRCNGNFASAPAASFDNGVGGFANGTSYSYDSGISYGSVSSYGSGSSFGSGGGGFGGGGFGSGGTTAGGGLIGTRAFRLLTVGGIATAIAVGASDDDDDVSPSE